MFTLEIVLAAILITSPPNEATAKSPWVDLIKPTLRVTCIDLQIVDPKDVTSFDLDDVRNANEKFRSYPLLEEVNRFPSKKQIAELLTLNRHYRGQLVLRLIVDAIHEEDIRAAIIETDQLYTIWDHLRDANCEYYYVSVRRSALRTARELVGDESFYLGYMPPAIPIRHLPRN